jgi:hypothetical protein
MQYVPTDRSATLSCSTQSLSAPAGGRQTPAPSMIRMAEAYAITAVTIANDR